MNRMILERQQSSSAYEAAPAEISEADAPTREKSAYKPLSERVSFLTDGELTVIIPKGAVIFMPGDNQISEGGKVQGQLVEWEEFFYRNRNAIRIEEVDGEQLQGLRGFPDETLEIIEKSKFPVITAFRNQVVALPEASTNPTSEQ